MICVSLRQSYYLMRYNNEEDGGSIPEIDRSVAAAASASPIPSNQHAVLFDLASQHPLFWTVAN